MVVSGRNMKFFVIVFVILISTYIVNASVLDPVIENVVHHQISKPPSAVPGIWKKKTVWKPRWVKEWKSAKVMKPIWRKVWGPIQIREWVPIPKPPPGWNAAASTPLAPVKIVTKDTTPNVPLWDPVPYPESQQPPPPSTQCGNGGCDEAAAFSQQQISGIIGSNHYDNTPDNSQAEYSETVTHLTRVPANNWARPQQSNFPELSQFLVPPRYQPLQDNKVQFPPQNRPQEISHSNGVRWTPLPPQNPKGHFITKPPEQPYKFQAPEPDPRFKGNNGRGVVGENDLNKPTFKPLPQADNDFIQAAQLVSEYHYSEFDLAKDAKHSFAEPEVITQPPRVEEREKPKPQPPRMDEREKPKPQLPRVEEKFKPKPQQSPPKVQKPQEAKPNPRPVRTENRPPPSAPSINLTKQTYASQEVRDIFPIFKLPASFPANHRFAQLKSNSEQPSTPSTNKLSTYVFESPDIYFQPQPSAEASTTTRPVLIETKSQYNTSSSDNQPKGVEDTTPFLVFSTSSFTTTTEAQTEGPVYVVTPEYTGKS